MILIADSGATKTDWCVIQQQEVLCRVSCKGLNPYLMDQENIIREITQGVLPLMQDKEFDSIYFYGAGCILDKALLMEQILGQLFHAREVHVLTDMQAAARSLCGSEPGIVCILGTGSNSCYYDGKEIQKNVPPLGFILGNEGSAAHIGKMFLSDLLRDMLTENLKKEILEEMKTDYGSIIDRIYRKNEGNALLSSLCPLIKERIHLPEVRQIVLESFSSFLRRNVKLYHKPELSVHFMGSIAYHFEDILLQACLSEGIKAGTICQSPMEGLIAFHRSDS